MSRLQLRVIKFLVSRNDQDIAYGGNVSCRRQCGVHLASALSLAIICIQSRDGGLADAANSKSAGTWCFAASTPVPVTSTFQKYFRRFFAPHLGSVVGRSCPSTSTAVRLELACDPGLLRGRHRWMFAHHRIETNSGRGCSARRLE